MASHRDSLVLIRWSRYYYCQQPQNIIIRINKQKKKRQERNGSQCQFSWKLISYSGFFNANKRKYKFTRKLLNKFDLIFHWGRCSVFLFVMVFVFLRDKQCIILNLIYFFFLNVHCHVIGLFILVSCSCMEEEEEGGGAFWELFKAQQK